MDSVEYRFLILTAAGQHQLIRTLASLQQSTLSFSHAKPKQASAVLHTPALSLFVLHAQVAWGDWNVLNDRFPDDLKNLTSRIVAAGFTPGTTSPTDTAILEFEQLLVLYKIVQYYLVQSCTR